MIFFYKLFASSNVSGSFFINVSGQKNTEIAAIIDDALNNIEEIIPLCVS